MTDLLNEALKEEALEAAAEAARDDILLEGSPEPARIPMPDFSFLLAPTGPGAIEEYVDHPLNYDGAKSTARILRGLTGIAGSLDYALIDIGLGLIEKVQEKKKGAQNGERWNYAGE